MSVRKLALEAKKAKAANAQAKKTKAGRALGELLQKDELPTSGQIGLNRRLRLRVGWSMGDIVIFVLGWGVLTIITLGIAALFLPYAVLKRILDDALFYDEDGVVRGRLSVDVAIAEQLGLIVIWFLIIAIVVALGIATVGLGLLALPVVTLLYYFEVARKVMERTTFIPAGGGMRTAST